MFGKLCYPVPLGVTTDGNSYNEYYEQCIRVINPQNGIHVTKMFHILTPILCKDQTITFIIFLHLYQSII